MVQYEQKEKNIDDGMIHYQKIRDALSGLYEVLNIKFPNKNDVFYEMGMDNLKGLHDNVVELMKKVYPPRKVRMKLREIEFESMEEQENVPF